MKSAAVDWKKSIFTRLIITFLLFMMPIFLLGIGIFQWSSERMAEAVSTSMESQTTNYMKSLDNDILRIVKLQSDLTQDEDLNKVANERMVLDGFELTRAILRIQQRLTAIKNSSAYIESASVLVPSLGRVLYDTEYPGGRFRDIAGEEVAELRKTNRDRSSQVIYSKEQLYLLSEFPNYLDGENEPLFIIQVFLSQEAMKEDLVGLYNYTSSSLILEKPTQGFVVDNIADRELQTQMRSMLDDFLRDRGSDSRSVRVEGVSYLLVYLTSQYTDMTLSVYLPEAEALESLRTLELWYWSFFLIAILFVVVYSVYFNRMLRKPLEGLIQSFRKVEAGDFDIVFDYKHDDELGYLNRHFIQMAGNLRILIDQVYRQKILAQKAELKQLQSQINPHFLYNSFFVLHRRIKGGDYENAVLFSHQLGNYFKYITRNTADEALFCKEVEHARIYAGIQGMRFSNRIRMEFGNLPDRFADVLVPRLILQPILENSFEHGLQDKKQDGILRVSFESEGDTVSIFIEDNGSSLDEEMLARLQADLDSEDPSTEITGMINIHHRIQLKYGPGSGITLSRSDLGGLQVRIDIHL